MPTLIKNRSVVENPWVIVPKDEALEALLARSEEQLLVPAATWLEHRGALLASGKQLGVWLDSDQHPEIIAADIPSLPVIALNFPVFSDGRAFSYAFALRKHYAYKGELRAIGDVLRDPLFYMKRCGFDAFDLADDVKIEDALSAFSDFHTTYASTVEEPLPLFRRRFAH